MVKIPVGIPEVLWLRGEDFGWDTSSFVAPRLGYPKCSGFVVKIPVGIPQVLWLCGENPGRIHPVFAVSLCRSRLGYLRVCGFAVKISVA